MSRSVCARILLTAAFVATCAMSAHAQQPSAAEVAKLPNPYRLQEGWPTLPKTLNGGRWGEVIRVSVARDGNIWVFHRCFNVVPPGSATCINRGEANPPVLVFDPAGKLIKSFGAGMFAYPHGFTLDADGNLWTTDVNDHDTVLGMSARNADGVVMGHEVLKLSPEGKVLMTLGKEGVPGNGPDTFDRPTGVAIAPNGDIFVSDGHQPNTFNNARIVKFDKKGTSKNSPQRSFTTKLPSNDSGLFPLRFADVHSRRVRDRHWNQFFEVPKNGKFIKAWGKRGSAPGEFDEPHDVFIGGSQQRVYVADRKNRRIQVFDQDGNFIADWRQFGEPSSVFVGKDDTIYVGAAFNSPEAKKGELRGIVVGNAKDGSLKAFIPDPSDLDKVIRGTSASGIAADDMGNIYAADVGTQNLRKYVKVN